MQQSVRRMILIGLAISITIAVPGICPAQGVRNFQISTVTYSGNAIGKTTSVSGYRAFYHQQRQQDGANRYTMYDFEIAGSVSSKDQLSWQDFPNFPGFNVAVSGYDDLPGAMDNLSSFEHASLDSFKIYVTLMDMIMYEQFRGVALDELLNAGKTTYDKAAYTVELPDWKPIIRGLKINAGATVFQHVNSGTDGNLFYYKTDDTIIRQIIFYGGFIMPSIGTSRYMGFYRLDADNELTHATLSEYYIGLVIAAYFLPVLSTERREQVLELIPEGPL